MTTKPVQSKFGIILILVLLNKDLVRGEDRGVTWKTKREKLRKDYRTYIFQNSISLLVVQIIPKRNPNITNKLNKFLVYACMLADVYFTCSIVLVIISFILQGKQRFLNATLHQWPFQPKPRKSNQIQNHP